jgi:hypothetical protein
MGEVFRAAWLPVVGSARLIESPIFLGAPAHFWPVLDRGSTMINAAINVQLTCSRSYFLQSIILLVAFEFFDTVGF